MFIQDLSATDRFLGNGAMSRDVEGFLYADPRNRTCVSLEILEEQKWSDSAPKTLPEKNDKTKK